MRKIVSIPFMAASLLAVGACSKSTPNAQQASNAPPPVTPAPALVVPPAPPPAPQPNPDEQLASVLDSMGAEQSDRGRMLRLSSAQFEPGQTSFAPSDSQRMEKVVALLRDHPETHVMIEGYTDSRGSDSANERIAMERAAAVRQMLVDRGVDSTRLDVKAMGEKNPIADNGTVEGRQQNRRVQLIFSDAQGRFASAGSPTPSG